MKAERILRVSRVVTDLTRAEWQSSMTDAQITASIASGKGRMPRFDLPANVVQGLVARIRASKGR